MFYTQVIGSVCLLAIGHLGVKAGFTLMGAIWVASLAVSHHIMLKDLWIYPLHFDPSGLKNYVLALKFHTQSWPHVGPYLLGATIGYFLERHRDKFNALYQKRKGWLLLATILSEAYLFQHPAYLDPLLSSFPSLVALIYVLDYTVACVLYLAVMLYFIFEPGRSNSLQTLWIYHQKLMLTYFWLHIPFSLVILSLKRATFPLDATSIVGNVLVTFAFSYGASFLLYILYVAPMNAFAARLVTCLIGSQKSPTGAQSVERMAGLKPKTRVKPA